MEINQESFAMKKKNESEKPLFEMYTTERGLTCIKLSSLSEKPLFEKHTTERGLVYVKLFRDTQIIVYLEKGVLEGMVFHKGKDLQKSRVFPANEEEYYKLIGFCEQRYLRTI